MNLSNRTNRIKPSPTMALTAKSEELKKQGSDIVGLVAGEPDFDTPDIIKQAAISALNSGQTKYTPVGGTVELKKSIIGKLKQDNELEYTPDEILVSCGGKHSLYNIFQALINEGDEVIIPAPYWVSYPDQVLLNDGKPVIIETSDKTDFKISPRQLEAAITPKTKILILNSPSNPTGSIYEKEELLEIADILVKNNILCVSDEIYEKILYDGATHTSIAQLGDQMKALTIIVNGASKAYSMTGWRMGFAAGPSSIIKAMTKIQGQVTSCINSITQAASTIAFEGAAEDDVRNMVNQFKKRRDVIVESLNRIDGITCLTPKGAFYVFPNVTGLFNKKTSSGKTIMSSNDFADYILEDHLVVTVPGEGFGAPGYLRLSYATSMENIEKALKRINVAVNELS